MSGHEIHVIRRAGKDESRILHTGGDHYPQVLDPKRLGTEEDLGRIFDADAVVPALASHLALKLRGHTLDELRRIWQEEYNQVASERGEHNCFFDLDGFLRVAEKIGAQKEVFGLEDHQVTIVNEAASFIRQERSYDGVEQDPARHFNVRYFSYLSEKLTDRLNHGEKRHPALSTEEAQILHQAADYLEHAANRFRPFDQPHWERPHKHYELVKNDLEIPRAHILHWVREVEERVLNEWPASSSGLIYAARSVTQTLSALRRDYQATGTEAEKARFAAETSLIEYADWLLSTNCNYDSPADCPLEEIEHEDMEESKERIAAKLAGLVSASVF